MGRDDDEDSRRKPDKTGEEESQSSVCKSHDEKSGDDSGAGNGNSEDSCERTKGTAGNSATRERYRRIE